MSAKVTIENGNLLVDMEGLDKLWALRSRLTIPLNSVRGVTADPAVAKDHSRWRGPGTYIPGVVSAGTFHQHGERIFWDVHNAANAVAIDLAHEQYQRLIIEVEYPEETVRLIEDALRS